MEERMIKFAKELEQLLAEGKDLREIAVITYQRRESGENIPYMMIGDTDRKTRKAIGIYASPIKSQKDLYEFFNRKRIGSVAIPVYTLRITAEEGVIFSKCEQRLGEKINLLTK
jgi:hypothetical protein